MRGCGQRTPFSWGIAPSSNPSPLGSSSQAGRVAGPGSAHGSGVCHRAWHRELQAWNSKGGVQLFSGGGEAGRLAGGNPGTSSTPSPEHSAQPH